MTVDLSLAALPSRHEGIEAPRRQRGTVEALRRRLARQRETIRGRDELLRNQARQIQEMEALIEDLKSKVILRTNSCDGCCEGEGRIISVLNRTKSRSQHAGVI